jgi:hypothetical protein
LALTDKLAGHVKTGGSLSLTMTLNVQSRLTPLQLTVKHATSVVPFGKVEPLGGVHSITPSGQVLGMGTVKVTLLLLHCPASVLVTISAGQSRGGGGEIKSGSMAPTTAFFPKTAGLSPAPTGAVANHTKAKVQKGWVKAFLTRENIT